MTSELILRRSTHEITDVAAIKVTEVTEVTEDGGGHVRAIRIFGSPGGTEAPPILEVIVRADDRDNIKVSTPELRF